ncbi:hypothetical protein LMJ53_00955 [Rheinheimera sp. UJ51]|uniref:DVU3141 family protein n=1 Tax=Rheinheimera sp. UJ51 TaxID=2892446 RepID=UPI001E51204F|nr:DVU3141 family protein [Rheinheimera sp. UJ51]MCC5450303.1 hypothetical protein [Rheinheimera sp. UJ51]
MPNFQPRLHGQFAALFCVAALSAGCVSTQQATSSPYHDYSNLNLLPSYVSMALQSARVGQQLSLSESPWGGNARLQVLDRYFAASGRNCLKFTVNEEPSVITACQYELQWAVNPEIMSPRSQG